MVAVTQMQTIEEQKTNREPIDTLFTAVRNDDAFKGITYNNAFEDAVQFTEIHIPKSKLNEFKTKEMQSAISMVSQILGQENLLHIKPINKDTNSLTFQIFNVWEPILPLQMNWDNISTTGGADQIMGAISKAIKELEVPSNEIVQFRNRLAFLFICAINRNKPFVLLNI